MSSCDRRVQPLRRTPRTTAFTFASRIKREPPRSPTSASRKWSERSARASASTCGVRMTRRSRRSSAAVFSRERGASPWPSRFRPATSRERSPTRATPSAGSRRDRRHRRAEALESEGQMLGGDVLLLTPHGSETSQLRAIAPGRTRRLDIRFRSPADGRRRALLGGLDLLRRTLAD